MPKAAILAGNRVESIRVTKTPLRMEDWNEQDISPSNFDRTSRWIATYYINPEGMIDSIYHYPNDSSYYKKNVFIHDAKFRTVEFKTLNANGRLEQRSLVEHTDDMGWYYRSWYHGELKEEVWSTSDSIIVKSVLHRGYVPEHRYMKYTFDLENDISTETSYHGDRIVRMESKHWISEEGIPTQFIFNSYSQIEEGDKAETKTTKFPMNSDGVVVNKLNGLFTDPFHLDNYFKRHQSFQGIHSMEASLLTMDELVFEFEQAEIFDYVGKSIVYLYRFEYVFAHSKD